MNPFRSRGALAWMALAVSMTTIPVGPAVAIETMYFFAWAHDASANRYEPNPNYSYHALGSLTLIERLGNGHYRLNWGRWIHGDDVLNRSGRIVTAYGSSSDYCVVDASSVFEVACYDAAGTPTDTQFSATIVAGMIGKSQPVATALLSEPSNPTNPILAGGLIDGSNVSIPVTRTGVGQYTAEFPGFDGIGTTGGNVQVTADRHYTGAEGHRCTVVSWGGTDVHVRCFDSTGALADTAFGLVYHKADADLRGVAFAWANDDTASSYTPHSTYSFNPTGGAVTANRSATGVYSITFAGMGAVGLNAGNVQVTAYSVSDRRCKVASWFGDTIHVRCFDGDGNPVDTPYTVIYRKPIWERLTENFAAAAVWGEMPIAPPQQVVAAYNRYPGLGSAQSPVLAARLSTGVYTIEFTDVDHLGDDGGNAQVTANGFDGNRCKVEGWLFDTVTVRCFTPAGDAIDESFTVALFMPRQDNEQLAYVWAGEPTQALQIPLDYYTHNPSGQPVEINRLATGLFRVTFTGLSAYGADEGVPLVTAYGSGAEICKLVSWNGDDVDVACMTPSGTPANARFSLIWFKPRQSADGFATAYADLPATTTWVTYAPLASKSHNPAFEPINAVRETTGEYSMEWEGYAEHAFDRRFLLTSTVGTDSTMCSGIVDGFADALVHCHASNAAHANAPYTVVNFTPILLPEPGFALQLLIGLGSLSVAARGRAIGATCARDRRSRVRPDSPQRHRVLL